MSELITGFKVGQVTDTEAATGVTVIICEKGATPGVDVRGAAPGTRETDLMRPDTLVDRVHAIVLAGGSAFGLAAADGAVRWLEEHGAGWPTSVGPVPIVGSAILYDLGVGDAKRRPDSEMGYQACDAAGGSQPATGSVGAGTGATVAKALGMERCFKGGLGFAQRELASGLRVQAITAANGIGSLIDSASGAVVAAPRDERGKMLDPLEAYQSGATLEAQALVGEATTLGVVMTDAQLTKQEATRLATMAHAGIARTVVPAYTLGDGDVVFVMATGEKSLQAGELSSLGAIAAACVAEAVVAGVKTAKSVGGIPAVSQVL
ncbi:MAG TPA: P1 family peptidase [Dehalococcoidia bacterium]|nr:P1 family peptidase [Dehalococcoidia bacterium]